MDKGFSRDIIASAIGGVLVAFFSNGGFSSSLIWFSILGFVCFLALLQAVRRVSSFLRRRQRQKKENKIFSDGSRYEKNIEYYVLNELAQIGFSLPSIEINDKSTNYDLKKMAERIPEYMERIDTFTEELTKFRRRAFELKYSSPYDRDEKALGAGKYGSWVDGYRMALAKAGLSRLKQLSVIEVGYGNGDAYVGNEELVTEQSEHVAVDLSKRSLEIARERIPSIQTKVLDAEKLIGIPNSEFDLYLALRTFQSTLFDRRRAIHEAARVLKTGGVFVASVPILYFDLEGTEHFGLSPSYGEAPTMKHARFVVDEIKLFLQMFFKDVAVTESKYELFVTARKV